MTEVMIVAAVRTPIGKRNGGLSGIHPVVLGALAIRDLLDRAAVDPARVQDVIWGCVDQVGEQGTNIARSTWLAAGLPTSTPGSTIDRQCASSQQAVHFAAALIQAGVCDVVVAGGTESMSRVPIGANNQGPGEAFPPELMDRYPLTHQGIAAQSMADKYGISRTAMDEFALRSHRLAEHAADNGHFRREIVPLPRSIGDGILAADEGIRRGGTLEALAALKPAFEAGHQITAANSSQVSDGAAAVLLTSAEAAAELGLAPLGRIAGQLSIGTDPVLMHEGPIEATWALLARSGLDASAIDLFEVSEAFASVVLAWLQATKADIEKVNVNGGAIALGHPLGASGARLMTTLFFELERQNLRYGLQTMCAGWGLGVATLIDRTI
ncbi:MAG: thiolase family protein [Streptosporangiaceae bacterium]